MKTKQTIALVAIIAVILGIVFVSQNPEKIVNILTFDSAGKLISNESFSRAELIDMIKEREAPLAPNAAIYPEKSIMPSFTISNPSPYDESDITDLHATLNNMDILTEYKPFMIISKGAKSKVVTLPEFKVPSSYSRFADLHVEFTIVSTVTHLKSIQSFDVPIDRKPKMTTTAKKPFIFWFDSWFK